MLGLLPLGVIWKRKIEATAFMPLLGGNGASHKMKKETKPYARTEIHRVHPIALSHMLAFRLPIILAQPGMRHRISKMASRGRIDLLVACYDKIKTFSPLVGKISAPVPGLSQSLSSSSSFWERLTHNNSISFLLRTLFLLGNFALCPCSFIFPLDGS